MEKTPHQLNTASISRQNSRQNFRQNKGFSMIEVLVAMVILSIGLLGLAGLQTTSLKANGSAYQRSQANIMANEILDRMRANRVGIAAGFYDDPYSSTPSDPDCGIAGATNTNCTVGEMAEHDVFLWETNLGNTLPGGRGAILGNGTGSVFTVTVMWDDNRNGATGTGCDPSDSTDLTCFVMSTRL